MSWFSDAIREVVREELSTQMKEVLAEELQKVAEDKAANGDYYDNPPKVIEKEPTQNVETNAPIDVEALKVTIADTVKEVMQKDLLTTPATEVKNIDDAYASVFSKDF